MDVKVLASGSDANMVYVGNGETAVLIDIGLAKTKAEKILIENGIDPTKIDGVFVTHEHGDHVKGLAFADKYKIPVYGSEGTLKALERMEWAKLIRAGSGRVIDALRPSYMTVEAFAAHHDAAEPLGYTISNKECKVSVLMDTGKVTTDMIMAMYDSDVYVFECNHDEDMVMNGPYHDALKQRVLCDVGHLSNDAAAAALAKLIRGKGEQIYLTHMSSNNNMPALALATVKRALKAKGFIAGQHYEIEVV
jgi:phosphoribosyl 1,2-cyclic phosphodiesterase